MRRLNGGTNGNFEIAWRETGYVGEPLIDEEAFFNYGTLSIFTVHELAHEDKKIVVLDFKVQDLVV